MARLEAVAKALYYPTQDRVIGLIAEKVRLTSWPAGGGASKPALLDPCAGEGRAAAVLAHRWDVVAHGIELHAERAAAARAVLSWARHGSYHQIAVLGEEGKPIDPTAYAAPAASRPFGILFLNPPYDEGTDEDGAKLRQEIEFLRATTPFLATGGLLVFIPPRHILKHERFREYMRQRYTKIHAYAYPEPEASQFDQVVVLATRGASDHGYGDVSCFDDVDNLPVLTEAEPYDARVPAMVARIEVRGQAPETFMPGDDEGAWVAQQWLAQTGLRAAHELAPLVAPRPGHQAMLLAAGALNGLEINTEAGCEGFGCDDTDTGGRMLVKGGSKKLVTKIEGKADGDGNKETIFRERISSYLSVLDLRTGILDTWQVDDDQGKTAEWFAKHGDQLAAGILSAHAPQFTAADLARYDFSKLRAPGILPGRSEPEILPVQKEAAAAVVHRWKAHKEAILCGEMGTGKEQPVSEPVLTPNGWVPIGQLRVGDLVVDPDTGGTTEVLGVYPQGRKPVFRCTFTDGTSALCGDEHLWEVQTPLRKWRGRPSKVLPLAEIRERLTDINGNAQHFIPLTAPVQYPEANLPIAPYVLGALLGDGSMASGPGIHITSADSEILARLVAELPPGAELRQHGCNPRPYDYYIASPGLYPALRALGLNGRRSWEKHVPRTYLQASVTQRVALLQGLLDTDGTVGDGSSTIEYSTTSPMLAHDVAELVQSLGGTSTTYDRTTHYTYKDEKRAGRLSYRVMIALPNEVQPFHLPRKLERLAPRTKYQPTRAFKSVEPAGEDDCVCIKVANPRGLYITRDYIVTHNTTMATLACELAGAKKVVLICPTHLTKKWVREATTITGRKGAAMIAKRLSDVDTFFASTATYLIISKEVAKLGARWEPAVASGSKIVQVEETVYDEEESSGYGYGYMSRYRTGRKAMVTRRQTFNACPRCGAPVTLTPKAQSRCTSKPEGAKRACGEPLFQYTPITSKGTKRWPLASYIHDRYARRYVLVVDEAHQHAKGETDQARAVHQLISGAKKVLMMTGTLYGGRASSIFHLLFRLDPAFRRAYKHTDCATFVEHHGLFETVFKEEERSSTYGYRKGTSGGRIREIPGMSPAMIPMLLPYTVFVKLKDLRLELPPYNEEVLIVEPDAAVQGVVQKLQGDLKSILRKHPKVMGAYLQACLGYPDRADQREEIYDIGEDGERTNEILASAPALPDATYPKDEALLELVRSENAAGRKVLVFFVQTSRRDARPRARALLEAAGFKVVQLDSNVAPEKREDWMRERVEEGFDVMFTNGRLVETGLDLMFANTIVQYGIEYSINTLRQSIRRSWRLGQSKPVRVVFMAYEGTMQAAATNLIAQKMRAAELVDGDEAGGLAQFDAGGGNFLLELAHEVLAGDD